MQKLKDPSPPRAKSRCVSKSLVPTLLQVPPLPDMGSPQKASSNVLANIVLEPESIDFTKWLVRATTPGRAR
jgi:hypothetical protein